MKREHLLIAAAGALLLMAVFIVLSRGPEKPEGGTPATSTSLGQGKPSRDPRTPRGAGVWKAGSELSPKEFEKELGESGFEILETRDSRPGLLRIKAPGNQTLGGDKIVAAPGGDGFHLRGNVSLRTGNTVYRPREGESHLSISRTGDVQFGSGDWKAEVLKK